MGTTNILDLNNRVDELEKSYPANKVMMSDGVTSVEEAVNGKADLTYFDQYTVSVVSQSHGADIQIHFTPTGIDYHLNGQKIWTISKNS